MRRKAGLWGAVLFALTFSCAFATSYPFTIKDALGRSVVIPKEPHRVVVVSFFFYKVFPKIGAEDKLIATQLIPKEETKLFPNFEKSLPYSIEAEAILSLSPDLVIVHPKRAKYVLSLERVGIPVFVISVHSLEDFFRAVLDVGKILNKEKEAEKYVAFLKGEIEKIRERAKAFVRKPRVYYEIVAKSGRAGYAAAGTENIANELIEICGGKNIVKKAGTKGGMVFVGPEFVIAENPDVIIFEVPKKWKFDPYKLISERKGWKSIKAVREKRVFVVYREEVMASPDILAGLRKIFEAIESSAK